MRQECNHLEEGLSDELMLTREEEEEIDVRLGVQMFTVHLPVLFYRGKLNWKRKRYFNRLISSMLKKDRNWKIFSQK
jgi:hypothetical protein